MNSSTSSTNPAAKDPVNDKYFSSLKHVDTNVAYLCMFSFLFSSSVAQVFAFIIFCCETTTSSFSFLP